MLLHNEVDMKFKIMGMVVCATLLTIVFIGDAFADSKRNFIYFECSIKKPNSAVLYSRFSNLYVYQDDGYRNSSSSHSKRVKATFDDVPFEKEEGLHLTTEGKEDCRYHIENDRSIGDSLYYLTKGYSHEIGGYGTPFEVMAGFHKSYQYLADEKELRELRLMPLMKVPFNQYTRMLLDGSAGDQIISLTSVVD